VAASILKTNVNTKSPEFEKNTRRMIDLVTQIKNEEEQIAVGGGAKAIESQHKKGRLTARERVSKLTDPGSQFFELGVYAAYEMYEEWGGAPSAGTITVASLAMIMKVRPQTRAIPVMVPAEGAPS